MARRKNGYVEPADFFPPEVRKLFEKDEQEKTQAEEKKQPKASEKKPKRDLYREETKRQIENAQKKKAAKK